MCLRGGGWEHPDQADPIIKPHWSQGLNRYAYAHNNPLNWIDPTGFETEEEEEEEVEEDEWSGDGYFVGTGGHDGGTLAHFDEEEINPSGEADSSSADEVVSFDADVIEGGGESSDGGTGSEPPGPPESQDEDDGDTDASDALDDSAQAASDEGSEGWRDASSCYAGVTADNEITPNQVLHEATPQVQGDWEFWDGVAEGMLHVATTVFTGGMGGLRGATKLLPAFTQTTRDAVLASMRLAKGATTRGASLLEKRVAEGVITGVKPTQASAERIVADVMGNPLRTQATGRFGQVDIVGRSFGQEVGIRVNTQTGNLIGFRRVDF